MKKVQANIIVIYSLLLAFLLSSSTDNFAQAKYHVQTFDLTISGTSSLHDWEMKSSKGQFDASISIANDNVLFTGLTFSMPAESLKSGHGMMDRNTYKALN